VRNTATFADEDRLTGGDSIDGIHKIDEINKIDKVSRFYVR
jgi:hypothetical protein